MTQQNLEFGPCRVSINEVEVGTTIGPVTLRVETLWRDRRSERFGQSVVDRIAVGCSAKVVLRLGEKTLANLQRALPHAAAGANYLSLGHAPGFKASSAAQSLRLHPEERADAGRDVLLHKTVASAPVEIAYAPGQGRAFEVEFTALLDPARADGDRLLRLYHAD